MTQDEIVEMAKQVGFTVSRTEPLFFEMLQSFAKLVAAKESEACAKVCENLPAALEEFDALGRAADAIRARGEA